MATPIGNNWAGIWQDGVWQPNVWSPFTGGVSIGINWDTIWRAGVWTAGVWAQEPALSPLLIPFSVDGNFGFDLTGPDIITALNDGSDLTYISTFDIGNVIQFTLTDSPYASVTGATLRVRLKLDLV